MTERIIGDGYVKRSFEEWRDIVFRGDPEKVDPWWSSLVGDQWDHPLHVIDYLTQLFSDPVPALEGLTDTQIANGLDYLTNMHKGGCWRELYRMRATTEGAVACVRTIYTLFEQLFALRCTPVPMHGDDDNASELNRICFMWWDIISLQSDRSDDRRRRITEAIDDVIGRTLRLPNLACQESALHGIGHGFGAPAMVDAYLAANPDIPPALRAYALNARAGRVQ